MENYVRTAYAARACDSREKYDSFCLMLSDDALASNSVWSHVYIEMRFEQF